MNVKHFTRELNEFTPCRDRKIFGRMEYLIGKLLHATQKRFTPRQVVRMLEALRYSARMHKREYRQDEITPYMLHLLEVANMLIEEDLVDFETLCAAILHDTVEAVMEATKEAEFEKQQERLEDISKRFGAMVKDVVDALTKRPSEGKEGNKNGYYIRQLKLSHPDCRPTMWQLAVAWRMVVIKFKDRTHNVRTLDCMPFHKQEKKIAETLEWFPQLRQSLMYVVKEMRKRDMKPLLPENLPDRLSEKLEAEISRHRKSTPLS